MLYIALHWITGRFFVQIGTHFGRVFFKKPPWGISRRTWGISQRALESVA